MSPFIYTLADFSQIETFYGEQAQAILTSAHVCVRALRTSEPKPAEWLSELVGGNERQEYLVRVKERKT